MGGMNVQTKKLNNPAKAPIIVPAFVPKSTAVIDTGTMAKVATIGPKAGSDPKGVKQNIASMAKRTLNCTRNNVLFLLVIERPPLFKKISYDTESPL
jgi:hypothetical protein